MNKIDRLIQTWTFSALPIMSPAVWPTRLAMKHMSMYNPNLLLSGS